MGLKSIFGSIGKAVQRPFKDVHKAVKKVGGGATDRFNKATGGGINLKKKFGKGKGSGTRGGGGGSENRVGTE